MSADPLSALTGLLRGRIADRLGWQDLRAAQKLAIEPILEGHNTLVLAPTAGGKTEAAFLPLLSALHDEQAPAVWALYVSPLKALLNNQEARLARLADMVGRTVFRWHGDVAGSGKHRFVRDPADILLITPESLEGLLLTGADRLFANLRAAVVDEAHAFAGTERGDHLASLIERVAAISRHDVQRIGLSATVGNPAALLEWLSGASRRARTVVDPPRSGVKRYFTLQYVETASMSAIAAAAAPFAVGKATMFFSDARRLAEGLRPALAQLGVPVRVHHASIDRKLREDAEQGIQREPCCLLCTSTMELGVDVGDLDAVLQLNAPTTVASYLQRMGRSGRRGAPGHMIVLADKPEGFLQAIALTELARRRWVEPVRLSQRAWGPFVHQIFALVVARGSIPATACFEALSSCWAFAKITARDFERLIDHLCGLNLLERRRNAIELGFAAEREFGDRGFAALCAVFDGGAPQITVTANGAAVGTLDRGYAGRLQRGASFHLAGQTWTAGAVDWQRGQLAVESGAAALGAVPSWKGAPSLPIAAEVAAEMRTLLQGTTFPEYLDSPERNKLAELREAAMDAGLAPGVAPVQAKGGTLVAWTFAGERINRVLGAALSLDLGCEARSTWSSFTLRPAGRKGKLSLDLAMAAWEQLAASGLSRGDRRQIL
ncbi:MAG: DEAD/DEAH box helicase, partial [Cyanobacteria bacterium REEB65]|nr:DEAD/DEAH box helicase [Cyanobacteria bacterium REEB65]